MNTVPWPHATDMQVTRYILMDECSPRGGEDGESGFSNELWDLCGRCWKTAPQMRPTTTEILVELDHIQSVSFSQFRASILSLTHIYTGASNLNPVYF